MREKASPFENVSCSFLARLLETVLDSVDIVIQTGTSVGIVGASGSGRSTITALLFRLYDPSHELVRISWRIIPEYNLANFCETISLVDQDPAVFSDAASRIFKLNDEKPTIDLTDSGPSPAISSDTTLSDSLAAPLGTIEFQTVELAYKSRAATPIFTKLNLTVNAGETVALVGKSGAGKASKTSLIERFYDPTSGAILLDGIDIRKVLVSQHRARLSLVSQDPDLFSGSVAFNVGLGARPGHTATKEEIIDACKAAGIMTSLVDCLIALRRTYRRIRGS